MCFRRSNFVTLTDSALRSEGRNQVPVNKLRIPKSLKLSHIIVQCILNTCMVCKYCTLNYIYRPSLFSPLRTHQIPVTKSNHKHVLHLYLRLSWYLITLPPSILFSSFSMLIWKRAGRGRPVAVLLNTHRLMRMPAGNRTILAPLRHKLSWQGRHRNPRD